MALMMSSPYDACRAAVPGEEPAEDAANCDDRLARRAGGFNLAIAAVVLAELLV